MTASSAVQQLIKKDREIHLLTQRVAHLTDEHNDTLRALMQRERENERLMQQLTDLRDSSIARELELASTRQALRSSEAERSALSAMQDSVKHKLLRKEEEMGREIMAEKERRSIVVEERNLVERDLRRELLSTTKQCSEQESRIIHLSEAEHRMREQIGDLVVCLEKKQHELDTAVQALDSRLRKSRLQQEEAHRDIAVREDMIKDLKQQVLVLNEAEASRSTEHRSHLSSLITNFNDLRAKSERQAAEIISLNADIRRLEADKVTLKARLKDLTALTGALQADKERVSTELRKESARLSSAEMELAVSRHKEREAKISARIAGALASELNSDQDSYRRHSAKKQTKTDMSSQENDGTV